MLRPPALVLAAFLGLAYATARAEPVTVRLWGSGGFAIPRKDTTAPMARANRAVIEEFQRLHPEIRLVVATGLDVQGPANESGLLMAMAGGMAPDVLYVNFRQLENFYKQGFLYPLNEFIARDPEVLKKIHPLILETITVDGKIYSFPYMQFVQALYYRKDLFRDAGLDPNRPPRDWDEFYSYAQKLTIPAKGQFGFGFEAAPQGTAWWWVNFLWQAGGEVVKRGPSGTWVAAFNTREGALALEFYRKLMLAPFRLPDGKLQRGVATRSANIYRDFIEKGKLGMWFQYQSDIIANQSTANISPALIGIAPMPRGPTGLTGNEINASMLGVSALQRDPRVRAAAWEFVKFMGSERADAVRTGAYVEAGLAQFVSPVSLRKHGYEELVSRMSDDWVRSMEQLFRSGKPEPPGQMIYTELDVPLQQAVLNPGLSARDVLNQAAAKIDTKLLGYVPPETMRERRRIALGVLVGGFALILAGAFVMLRKLSASVAGEPGSRPAGARAWRYHLLPWLFMAPAVLSIAVWAYYPLARGLVMAFQDYRITQPSHFIGLDNFIEAATQETFWRGIRNSFEYVGISLAIGFGLPILLALMLSEVPRGKMLFRTLYYLPAVTSSLVVLFLWKQFYDPSPQGLLNRVVAGCNGVLNGAGNLLHLGVALPTEVNIDWLGDPSLAMLAVILPGIWAGAGPGSIIYLAALKTIPDEMYEAADLDGAGVWTKIRMVTLPSLKPLIIINLVGAFIGAFKAMENIFVMTGGGPVYRTHTIGLEVWYNAFMYLKFGYATAAAWIMGALLIGFTLYQLRILRDVRFSAGG